MIGGSKGTVRPSDFALSILETFKGLLFWRLDCDVERFRFFSQEMSLHGQDVYLFSVSVTNDSWLAEQTYIQ